MKARNKKALSLLLSLAMAISLPTPALAAETSPSNATLEESTILAPARENQQEPTGLTDSSPSDAQPKPSAPILWDFNDGTTQGWFFDNSWAENSYHGPVENVCSAENGRLKVQMDYSKDTAESWLQPAISITPEGGLNASAATALEFEMYYDPNAMSTGNITIKATAGTSSNKDFFNNQMASIQDVATEDVDGGLKKAVFQFELDSSVTKNETANKLMLLLVGNSTDYKGYFYFDNIHLYTPFVPDEYVDATETAATKTAVSTDSSALTVNGSAHEYASNIQLADPQANASAVAIYQYLKAVGESDAALYGHMEDTVLKAGANDLSDSDTKDLTGSLAAINGLDCGGLFSGFASKYNTRHPEAEQLPETTEGNIKAAALLSNEAIKEGAIMTLSCHMPNFAFAEEKNPSAAKTYDRFDYSTADSYNLKGNCMNQILPGGQFNPQFTAFLDLIAEYANQLDGALLFRPFHENTGSWFWWGKAFCDAETYKSVFKYTVEYLRDTKDVHNLLYVYGPGSEAATVAEYGERYPGDAFVDMVGFDTYDDKASNDESYTFLKNFESVIKVTDQFAKEHNKLFAVTETGITNSAMKKSGNERPEWFTEILDIVTNPNFNCAYYMVWSNYDSKSNYYSPFAVSKSENGTLHGHELMDGFIRFYNNSKSIFAADQKAAIYGQTKPASPTVSGYGKTGYITAPTAGVRILEEVDITAHLSKDVINPVLSVSNGTKEIKLETTMTDNIASAKLTKEILAQLGEAANGKIILSDGTEKLAEITVIFNIPEKEPDPYMVDDFESYFGVDSMLTAAWATNKASGSTIDLNLTNAAGESQDGYAMKFTYTETSGGWAGATINKEVNWSGCNALSFWTIPDGKKQKTVIQIQANDTCYETYLNLYEAYNARAGQPTLVTIPFAEFCQRDTEGNPKGGLANDCTSVTSFGLWVNAIDNEFFEGDTVSGVIWYDNITAIQTDLTEPAFTDPVTAHTHAWDEGKVTVPATCKQKGIKTFTCACGETRTEDIPMTEHSWDKGIVTAEATCKAKGVKTFTCTTCKNTKTEDIPTISHAFQSVVHRATTGKNGDISEICTLCGDIKGKQTIYAAKSLSLKTNKYVYNSKKRKPAVTVKDSKGKTIPKKYYTVSYKNNKNVGKATVTVTLKTHYSGKLTKTFRILPKRTTLSKVKAAPKGFKVTWKKQTSQTSGYEIQYSTNKKFTKKTTKIQRVSKNKTTSRKISKLKSKKKYYVRIRTYKNIKINKKTTKFYSGWSKVKTVTTK